MGCIFVNSERKNLPMVKDQRTINAGNAPKVIATQVDMQPVIRNIITTTVMTTAIEVIP